MLSDNLDLHPVYTVMFNTKYLNLVIILLKKHLQLSSEFCYEFLEQIPALLKMPEPVITCSDGR